ncbi:hypothetical protein IJJ54_01280 [Candidatus Saccharibacteria bacterium]|nr:hypothetical protein [Candidatus Saccharibacteria bacterium]
MSICITAFSWLACSADSGGSQGSGGSASSCGTIGGVTFTKRGSWYMYPSPTCEATGVGWAYFTYANGWNKDLDYAPATAGTGGANTIPKECTKWGGFYHFGYMDEKYGTSPDGDLKNGGYTVTNGRSKAVMNGYASIGNIARLNGTIVKPSWKSPHWQKDNTGAELPPSISQEIVVNGTVAAVGDHFEYDGSVKQKYLKWLEVAPAGTSDIWDATGENGISYFCYGSTVDKPRTSFSAVTKGFVNGSQKSNGSTTTINNNSATVKFEHTITRSNDGSSGSVREWYRVQGDWPTEWHNYTWIGKGQSAMVHMPSARSVNILPGQTSEYRQRLEYDTKGEGDVSNTVSGLAEFVLKIYRPGTGANAITGTTSAKVNNTNKSSGSVTEVSGDGKYTISFQHTLKRGNDQAGGTVDSRWSTAVRSYDSANRTVNPGGTARSDTQTLSQGQQANVVPFTTETFSGTLLPDESRTFCQTLSYESEINQASGNRTSKTSEFCVTVHRPKQQMENCQGKQLSVKTGENMGSIDATVFDNSAGQMKTKSTGIKNTSSSLVELWARPGHNFVFEEVMCEGAELPNQYHSLGKNINYKIEANRPGNEIMKGSLAYSTPTSWSNSGINNQSFAGVKDIWGRSVYENYNQSPRNDGSHSVRSDYVGTTLEQKLTWSDLWINNGAVNGAHSGNNSATATAQIHVPYNYITTTDTTTNNNPHVVPGTNTHTITTTITVNKRKNTPVNGNTPYSTRTKPTKVQLVSFHISSDRSEGQVQSASTYKASAGGDAELWRVCGAFISGGPYNCESQNLGDDVVISADGSKSYNTTIKVPENTPIGTKVCAVVAVWPADSHNMPGDITQEGQEYGAMDDTENEADRYWGISSMSCSTVSKKPNIQVRQSGAFAQNYIDTAVSDRSLTGDGDKRSYGSWADYELISGKTTLGMGSGAIFWSGINFTAGQKRACISSALSVSNKRCSNGSGTVGNATSSTNKNLSSNPENVFNKLIARYTKSVTPIQGGRGESDATEYNSVGACRYNASNHSYEPYPASAQFTCLENGAYYAEINGSAKTPSNITSLWQSSDGADSSNTEVIHVKGTFYIGQDFHYGIANNGRVVNADPTYYSLSEIPQKIIIADDIKISPWVTHLDAWLVARNSINTCYVSGSGPEIKRVSVGGANSCDRQLTVTGPVIAKKLYLYRTHGGGKTTAGGNTMQWWRNEDSQGAEIFKVSPLTYLWSYSQAERYSQATTTYQRELPTKY